MSRHDVSWLDAETDPKVIRCYDHPTDGRYLLGSDVAAWLRDLEKTAREAGTAASDVFYTPLLGRMVELVDAWLSDPKEAASDGD